MHPDLRFDGETARAVLEAAPDATIVTDGDGRVVFVNHLAEEMFGYPRGELLGEHVERLVPIDRRGDHAGLRQGYLDHPTARPMGAGVELSGQRADGTTFDAEISLSPLTANGQTYAMASIRDVSVRVTNEVELRRQRAELAVYADRERIARDLHDSVIQRLFATGLTIQAVSGRTDGVIRDELDGAVDALDDAIRDLRSAIFGLRYHDQTSVRRAVLDEAVASGAAHGFRPRVQFGGSIDAIVNAEVAVELIAALRELLSNAGRHAHATEVTVSVTAGDGVVMEVLDDGVGMPEGGPARSSGLTNLSARASALGGSFELSPGPRGGTLARFAVPRPTGC